MPSGVLIYYLEPGQASTRLTLFDRRGRETQALTDAGAYRQPRFSPDGARIVAEKASLVDSNVDLWIYDVARQSAVKLTSGDAPDVNPVWSPDGKRVVFSSKRDSTYQLFTKIVDGTEAEQPLEPSPGDALVEHWSHDGQYLSVTIPRNGLWIFPLAPGQKPWNVRSGLDANTCGSRSSRRTAAGSPTCRRSPAVPRCSSSRSRRLARAGRCRRAAAASRTGAGDGQELFYIGGDSR